jgi:predicted nucleic acid-binding protein
MNPSAETLLSELNAGHLKVHRAFEEAFWLFKMGDHTVKDAMNEAEEARDAFRADARNLERVRAVISASATLPKEIERLRIWEDFFNLYQTPAELMPLKAKIGKLESDIEQKLATATEGYIDPHTNAFAPASKVAMRMMVRTNRDEAVRKACFDALEKMATLALEEYSRYDGVDRLSNGKYHQRNLMVRKRTQAPAVWLDRPKSLRGLQGVADESMARQVLRELSLFEIYDTGGKELAVAAARNFRLLRQRGRTVRKTIDGRIATFCLEQGFSLLHCDRDYEHFEAILQLSVIHP